jgi:hypothetical protein
MYRNPKPEEMNTPLFECIWQAIKSWDINVPSEYGGYMGATGNHVCAIMDAVADAGQGGREQLARWMISHSFTTGHGDKFADLLNELSWQVAELRARREPDEGQGK